MIPIGFALHPDEEFLELTRELVLTEADYCEVAPETLWFEREDGALQPNAFHRRFAALKDETKKGFVAHGVGFSMGTRSARDAARRARWLERMRADQRTLEYAWWTDHLGATSLAGLAMTLPLPLPMTPEAAAIVRERIAEMQEIVPDAGVENNVPYFFLGAPLDEPAFIREILTAPRAHLLLDLFNVTVIAENAGFDPAQYIDALDLSRVIELHIAGGGLSDPSWLPSGRRMRLDSHDSAVPELVWRLLEDVVPRCPNLRGVTLERMEGTVSDGDVPGLFEEMRRARKVVGGAR